MQMSVLTVMDARTISLTKLKISVSNVSMPMNTTMDNLKIVLSVNLGKYSVRVPIIVLIVANRIAISLKVITSASLAPNTKNTLDSTKNVSGARLPMNTMMRIKTSVLPVTVPLNTSILPPPHVLNVVALKITTLTLLRINAPNATNS